MDYQCFQVADDAPVGEAGPLPAELVGLAAESLADLSAALDPCPAAFAGLGFAAVAPAPDFAALRAAKAAAIDQAATATIAARLPLAAQLQLTKRAVQLIDARLERELTEAEAAERLALIAEADWSDAVRAHAAALKADLAELGDDAEGIAGFEIAGWPAPPTE